MLPNSSDLELGPSMSKKGSSSKESNIARASSSSKVDILASVLECVLRPRDFENLLPIKIF
jgi:hypothetical protein